MKIKIINEDTKLVSFWDIYGKELEVKGTKVFQFASGPKTYYIVELGGREYEVPEDMIETKRKPVINPDIVRDWGGDWITDGQILALEDALRESDIEPHQYFRIKNFKSPDQEGEYLWARVATLRNEIRPGMEPADITEEQIREILWAMLQASRDVKAGKGKMIYKLGDLIVRSDDPSEFYKLNKIGTGFFEISKLDRYGKPKNFLNIPHDLSTSDTYRIADEDEIKEFESGLSDEFASKGKKVDLGIAVKGEFTTDGDNYYSGWYFQSQDWNGFKIPYFEDKEAREVIESAEGLSVGRLYGGKLSDKGWWYSDPGAAPADRTVITGQKIQTTDGEKEVWSIGGFEWAWGLQEEDSDYEFSLNGLDQITADIEKLKAEGASADKIHDLELRKQGLKMLLKNKIDKAGEGAKIEKMENKYYYLPIGRIFKDSGGVRFQISGYTPEALKIKRYSEVEKDTAEAELSFGAVPTLAEDKKITFEGATLETWRDMRLLELEIDSIKKQLIWEKSRNSYQAELEQTKSKIENLTLELTQVKTEANALMEDLGKKSAGFKDSLDAMEAIAKKEKKRYLIQDAYGIQHTTSHLKERPLKGDTVETLMGKKVIVKKIIDDDQASKGKEVGDSQVDYFIEKFKDKMSGSSKSSALGWLDVPELSSREKMTVWNKIQPYISKEQDPAFIPENWTKYKWFNNKASKGAQVSPCTDCDTKLKAFIAKFPNKAKSWAQATDEIRDLARSLRDYYNDEYNLAEGEKGYIDGLPFREFKTPSEWNTKAKKQILSTWKKLNKEQKESFASNNSFLNPDND